MRLRIKDKRTEVGGKRCVVRGKRWRWKGKRSPVKFAALVFFKEFNGASRGQGIVHRSQKSDIRDRRSVDRSKTYFPVYPDF